MPAQSAQPHKVGADSLERLTDPSWAWAPYSPDAGRPWNLSLAAHLYRRTALAAKWSELQDALQAGPRATVDKLLRPRADVAAFNLAFDGYEKAAGSTAAWWLRRLIETPHPLLEQMTLFWHSHFALTGARVNNPAQMCAYVQLLRRHALGRFDKLLEAVFEEPALFVCLGARANRKARPEQDLPRVLLEQYTVGPGQYSDEDTRTIARAFTGWFISQNELRHIPREHDQGVKKLFGQEGDFERKDALRILLGQPATARFVVRKVFRWFVSETVSPPDTLLAPLAADFAKDFDVARVVETILRSNLFFSAGRQKIKSPVEFALSIIRPFEQVTPTQPLAVDLAALGQDLLQPPTVKGWAGGQSWINRFTVLGRTRLAEALLAGGGPYEGRLDPAATARKCGHSSPAEAGRFLFDLLVQDGLPGEAQQKLLDSAGLSGASPGGSAEGLRRLAARIATTPEFNLA